MKFFAAILSAMLFFLTDGLQADQIEMQNGDHYSGTVVSMTAQAVILQNDVLGKITLPRNKVARIGLGTTNAASVVTNQATNAAAVQTNANPDIAAALRNLGANTNFIEQVRKQFLNDAGPAANNKYDELVAGLFNGKFDMDSLRAQAKAAADQIRVLKQQGGDVGESLDSYLAILDNFLRQNPSTVPPAQTAPLTTTNHSVVIIR